MLHRTPAPPWSLIKAKIVQTLWGCHCLRHFPFDISCYTKGEDIYHVTLRGSYMSCHTKGGHVMSHLGEDMWNATRREDTCHVTLRGGINEMS